MGQSVQRVKDNLSNFICVQIQPMLHNATGVAGPIMRHIVLDVLDKLSY